MNTLFSVDGILAFLNDRSDMLETHQSIRKDLETKKALVDSVNALVVVGAFIAGVQAQMISFTYASNKTTLQIATNYFAFIGLTLDVIGTSSGVIHAIVLQRSMKRSQDVLLRIETSDRRNNEILHLLSGPRLSPGSPVEKWALQKIVILLQEEISLRSDIWDMTHFSSPYALILPSIIAIHPTLKILLLLINMSRRDLWGLGQIPLFAMGYGIFLLQLSIICFAADSQGSGVWVTCVAVAGSYVLLSLIPALIPWIKDRKRKERIRVFGEVERKLDQLRSNLR